jgi:hypothetical protein
MPEYEVERIRPPSPEEERLADWFAEQRLRSPDHLEAAARQMIGLVTGLLGLLLGVVAVAEKPLPSYVTWPLVRWLTVAGIALLLLALIAGLVVLWPRRMAVSSHSIADQRQAFQAILRHKALALSASLILFCLGLSALVAVLVLAVLYVV